MNFRRRTAPRSSLAPSSVTLPLRDSAERLSNIHGPSSPHTGSTREGKSTASRGRLLVGIDYGTAHTSVAYSHIPAGQDLSPGSLGARLGKVSMITKWPGGPGTAFVPTVTMYDSAQRRSRAPNLPKWWGYKVQRAIDREEAPDAARAVHLAKLILHEARETEIEASRLRNLAEEVGRKEIDLIMDFLQQLYTYLLGEDGYFKVHHATWLVESDVEFVFGVPAAWSEPEQQAMVEAAKSLGFVTASRGSEPEAMAASYFAQHETSIEVGDTFVICDAGGGTVDLITYTVVELHPLRVNEASVAEGVLCGSIYLNRELRKVLERRLATESYLRDVNQTLENAMKDFEDIKREFNGTNKEYFTIPGLRPNDAKGFKANKLWLSSKELREEVFDPIVHQVVQIIWKQVESSRAFAREEFKSEGGSGCKSPLKIKNIVLGGGFADNPYLYNTIRQAFSGNKDPEDNIPIQRVSTVGPAVAQGLVAMVSNYGLVKQRRSRLSYGILTRTEWNEKLHGDKKVVKATRDLFDRDEKCRWVQVIDWLVRQGQPVPSHIELPIRERCWNINSHDVGLKTVVYACDFNPSTAEYTLLVDKPKNCQEYVLETDFPNESMDEIFERKKNKNFYTVYWNVSLNIQENSMIWSVVLKLKNGQRPVTVHEPLFLDAMETSSKILGSLADRMRPIKPRSNLSPRPLTPRKRCRVRESDTSQRKFSRFACPQSPREAETDMEYQPELADGDESNVENQSIILDEDIYDVSD